MQFLQWLLLPNDIFWVGGKAGSGKSTLMKFLCGHHDEQAGLQRDWNLLIASYLGLQRSKYEIWSSEPSNLKQLEDSGNYANKGIVSSSNTSPYKSIPQRLSRTAKYHYCKPFLLGYRYLNAEVTGRSFADFTFQNFGLLS